MTNTIAGINYDEQRPAFKHIIIHPHFIKDRTGQENIVRSMVYLSEWKRDAGKVKLTVTIPSNTTSTLYLDKKQS